MRLNLLIISGMLCLASCTAEHSIVIHNDSGIDRREEIVEADISKLTDLVPGDFIILDSDGNEVAYQQTYSGSIIFPATVQANAKATYTVKPGKPAPCDTLVRGRLVPERLDDMTWENDLGAYRAYGPALQRTGERAFGYDVWTKSVHHLVVDKRYHNHIRNNISFHEDHGEGMDVYAVGPTLGAGTAALLDSAGNIVYPYCFDSFEILDNGPLRFTVRLTYKPITVDADSAVVETRLITLDKGSFLNRTTVSYSGLSAGKTIVPGIVVHDADSTARILDSAHALMAHADPTQNPDGDNGTIFTGIVSPASHSFVYMSLEEPVSGAEGHLTAPAEYAPGSDFTYWWGASWSKGFTPDMESWKACLDDFAERQRHPLTIIFTSCRRGG